MSKKAKQKNPELRFKEFQEKLLNTTFKTIVLSSQYGPRFNADDYDVDGNVKTIRGTDISLDGEIKYSQVPIAKLDFDFIKNHILQDGDLVMITTADCGATGVFRKQDFDYIPSAYAVKITLNEMGDPEYFKYFFQTDHAKSEIRSFIRKATVANLPCSDILRIKLNLPNIREQAKVTNFLTKIDKRLTQLRRKRELLQTYKRGVMQKIFSQQIRFKNTIGNSFPNWKLKILNKLIEIKGGYAFSSDFFSNDETDKILLTPGNFHINGELYFGSNTKYYKGEVEKEHILSNGDLLIVMTDLTKAMNILGNSVILESDKIVLHNQRIGKILIKEDSSVTKQFLRYLLNSHNCKNQIREKATGSTVRHISNQTILSISSYIPIVEEQEKIVNFLTSIDKKIEAVSRQIDRTEQFKKGLLQKMFV